MSTRWQTQRLGGRLIQAGVPMRATPSAYEKAHGLLMRGVVTATYEVDNPDHPVVNLDPNATPVAIYCDVLCYSSMPNQRWTFLRRCLVSQPVGGIHRGRIWKPRAATLDVTNNPIDLDANTNPANLDGDHVLVGFLDHNLNTPVIIRGIPHPSNDIGNEEEELGHRMKLKVADGDPDFWKHHGAYFGVDAAGDFVVDTTQAYDGELEEGGVEPDPTEDGSAGNVLLRLQKGATLTVEVDGDNFKLELADGDAKLTLGDGAVSAAVAEHLEALWNAAKSTLDIWGGASGHIHSTGVGPSGPPSPALSVDAWDPKIVSDKVKFPDTT